jgi:hypothetical protein
MEFETEITAARRTILRLTVFLHATQVLVDIFADTDGVDNAASLEKATRKSDLEGSVPVIGVRASLPVPSVLDGYPVRRR